LSRWRLVCSGVLTLLVFAFGARRACCEPRLVIDLDYRTDAALEGCPSEAAFRAQIESQLGYDPFRANAAQKVVARAAADGDNIKGFVRWYDASGTPRGERELSSAGKNCPAFARAMSFAIAVQIQLLHEHDEAEQSAAKTSESAPKDLPASSAPGRASSPSTPPRGPSSGTPPRASSPGTSPLGSSTEPTSGEAPRWLFMVGAGPGARFGVSPRAAAEARLFAAIRRDRFAVELGADASLPSRNPETEGAGFEQNLVGGSLAGCALVPPFSGCLVNRYARVAVRGFGVDVPHSSSALVVQLGPRLALNGSFARGWMGALRIDALVALSPWRVTLREQEVWHSPAVSLAIGADLVAVFNDHP
jgi:hypothetical protein